MNASSLEELDVQIHRAEIEAALEETLADDAFNNAPQLSAFLRFVVEEALAGRAGRVNAYAVATMALGRPEDFDPQVDPLVRVTARRLRQALAERNAPRPVDEGRILIELPVGGYAPRFLKAGPNAPAARSPSASFSAGQAIGALTRDGRISGAFLFFVAAILAFGLALWADRAAQRETADLFPRLQIVIEGDQDASAVEAAARSMAARFDEITLLAPDSGASEDYRLALWWGPSAGEFGANASRRRVFASLERRTTGRVVWSQDYVVNASTPTAWDRLLTRILSPVLSPYGVLYADVAEESANGGYACVASAFRYFDEESRDRRLSAQACLERLVADGVDHATIHALRAYLHLDGYRQSDPSRFDRGDALAAALRAANEAVRSGPGRARAHQAQFDVMKIAGRHAQARRSALLALEANPNDLDILTDYAAYLIARGALQDAAPIVHQAEELSLRSPAWFDAYRAIHA